MKTLARKALVASLALSVLAGSLSAVTAEAGPKYRRGERRVERKHERRYERHHARHHHQDRRVTVVHRDARHRHGPAVVPFLGGVAVGAIIGSQRSCPPPPPRRRAYVYECGYCDGDYRDYAVYIDHLIIVHHVDRCDIDRYYPMYAGGYWEEY